MLLIKYLISIIILISIATSVIADKYPVTVTVNKTRLHIDQSRQTIESVMSMEAFKTSEKSMDFRFKFDPEEESIDEPNELWGKLLLLIARGVEYLLWSVPVILLLFVIYYRKYWISYLIRSNKEKHAIIPDILSGMELNPETLPDNIIESAIRLWQGGEEREALSLLFRASLINIFTENKITITKALTEHECINVVNHSVNHDLASYFKLIAGHWIKMAYGHVKPDQDEFNQLCSKWGDHFGNGVSQ